MKNLKNRITTFIGVIAIIIAIKSCIKPDYHQSDSNKRISNNKITSSGEKDNIKPIDDRTNKGKKVTVRMGHEHIYYTESMANYGSVLPCPDDPKLFQRFVDPITESSFKILKGSYISSSSLFEKREKYKIYNDPRSEKPYMEIYVYKDFMDFEYQDIDNRLENRADDIIGVLKMSHGITDYDMDFNNMQKYVIGDYTHVAIVNNKGNEDISFAAIIDATGCCAEIITDNKYIDIMDVVRNYESFGSDSYRFIEDSTSKDMYIDKINIEY